MRRTKAELEALHKTAGIMWGRAHALSQTTFGGILRSRVDKCFEVGSLVALDCVRGFDSKRYGQVGILTKVTLRRGDKTCPRTSALPSPQRPRRGCAPVCQRPSVPATPPGSGYRHTCRLASEVTRQSGAILLSKV